MGHVGQPACGDQQFVGSVQVCQTDRCVSRNHTEKMDESHLWNKDETFIVSQTVKLVENVFLSVRGYGDVICRHSAATTLKPFHGVYLSDLRSSIIPSFSVGDKVITGIYLFTSTPEKMT